MSVERIQLPAIRYTDDRGVVSHLIPLRDLDEGGWLILDEEGISRGRSADSIREYADEWDADSLKRPNEDESIAAKRALADLLDELTDEAEDETWS